LIPNDGYHSEEEKKDIHSLVFQGDVDALKVNYERGHFTLDDLEVIDHRGNKPLHLAAKLSK